MDLNGWTGNNDHPNWWTALKIHFGARRFRCEYCRFNFASFRKRKEAFTFKRWEKMKAGQARAEGRARVADLEAQLHEAELKADMSSKKG
jgi:hypothetical protein